jgi:FkbM family methyltransferase
VEELRNGGGWKLAKGNLFRRLLSTKRGLGKKIEQTAVLLNELLRKTTGYAVRRNRVTFDEFKFKLLESMEIDLVVDGGANEGQWGQRFLASKSVANLSLLSCEPASEAFKALVITSSRHPNWKVRQVALGSQPSIMPLQVAGNQGLSSSLLKPKEHLKHYESVLFKSDELVEVIRLSDLEEVHLASSIFLKLDVQGFELEALKGSLEVFDKIRILEIETSFDEMYEGQNSFTQLLNFLESQSFRVVRFSDPGLGANGEMLYCDILAIK